jgi:hypothetical protein
MRTPFCRWIEDKNASPSLVWEAQKEVSWIDSTDIPLFPFLIYYGNQYPPTLFDRFATTILEPDHYRNVSENRSECYAYLSLGEVHPSRTYFSYLAEHHLLYSKHSIWESHLLPLSLPWQRMIFDEIVPSFIQGGYRGIMLDTVESLLHYKLATPKEILSFVTRLKQLFPSIKNRVEEAAKLLGISAETVRERVRVLTRRDKIGRTGVYLNVEVPKERSVEDYLRIIADRDPAIRRRVRG